MSRFALTLITLATLAACTKSPSNTATENAQTTAASSSKKPTVDPAKAATITIKINKARNEGTQILPSTEGSANVEVTATSTSNPSESYGPQATGTDGTTLLTVNPGTYKVTFGPCPGSQFSPPPMNNITVSAQAKAELRLICLSTTVPSPANTPAPVPAKK